MYYISYWRGLSKSKMLSFRLDAMLLRKVNMLTISKHRSRGEIIREALELYFRAYNPVAVIDNGVEGSCTSCCKSVLP